MTTPIHAKIAANVSLKAWRSAPELTKSQRMVKSIMINRAMKIKRGVNE
ncbi:hypothetical protein VPHF89G1_0064 [Vibrio phage F89 g1]